MSSTEQFITLVLAMREAQRDYFEQPTQKKLVECKKLEKRVDAWLQQNIAEKVQLELWSRSVKSSELPGVYDVGHETQKQENTAA